MLGVGKQGMLANLPPLAPAVMDKREACEVGRPLLSATALLQGQRAAVSPCAWASAERRQSFKDDPPSTKFSEGLMLPTLEVDRNASCRTSPSARRESSCGIANKLTRGASKKRQSSSLSALTRSSQVEGDAGHMNLFQGALGELQVTSIKSTTIQQRSPCRMQQVREKWSAMEAERKAKEETERKRKEEQMREAAEIITQHVCDLGESELAKSVVSSMKEANKLVKACQGSKLNHILVDDFLQTAKRRQYGGVLRSWLPAWNLSGLQKEEIVGRILNRHSSAELSNPQLAWFTEALTAAVSDSSSSFMCPICMDPMVTIVGEGPSARVDASRIWFATARKTEHWTNEPCGHACCRSCMTMWAETEINDHKLRVKCPAAGCSYNLFDYDVEALVSPEVVERFHEHKNSDYLKHLKKTLKEDPILRMWLKSHARPCPDCHVIVSRSEGCDHMVCVCGTRFCYACGFERCKCRKSKKANIWNPKE